MDNISQFIDFLKKYTSINRELEIYLFETLIIKAYNKHEVLLEAEKTPKNIWFILEGSAKATYPNHIDFEEKTCWFWNANELIFPLNGIEKKSNINIYLTSNSNLITISILQLKIIEQLFLNFLYFQNAYLAQLTTKLSNHLYYLQHFDSKDRFIRVRNENPLIFKQYNLKDLAEYLGMSERTLKHLRSLKL